MKKSFLLLFVAALFTVPSNAQLLNRLADKAAKAAEKGVTKAVEKSVEKTTEKATEKALNSAEKAVEAQVDRGINELNATTNELNRYNDSLAAANAEYAAQNGGSSAGLQGLMGSYMTLMGVAAPTYEDKGDEVLLSWDYVSFKLEWLAKFKGDECNDSKMMYTFQTPELATQFYREQIADLEKADADLWSVDDKVVTQDNTAEYKGQDKVSVKASMQQIVLSMGGKLE
jgi:ribosomal protein S20